MENASPPVSPPPNGETPSSTEKKVDYTPPWAKAEMDATEAKAAAAARAEKRQRNQRKNKVRRYRGRVLWVAFFVFVYWFYNPHGIFVFGDPLSVARYRGVLKDLKKELPDEYELVREHVNAIKISYIITGGNYGGLARPDNQGGATVRMLENAFIKGPGYAHSVLVHEACHGLQFKKNLPFTPFCENQAREHACNQWGIKVLKHFEAKPKTLKYYEGIAQGSTVYGNSCLRSGKVDSMPEL